MMRILVGCECSGIVRRALAARGHYVRSCDLRPAEDGSPDHIIGDVRAYLDEGWDALIAHPPCTRLANSGVRWLHEPPGNPPQEATRVDRFMWASLPREDKIAIMWRLLDDGAALFSAMWNAPIPLVAVENPVMHKHAKARITGYQPFAQSVQPWQFGHDESGPDNVKKRTCFWLRGLPPLIPTGTLDGSTARDEIHKAPPGDDRAARRSRFFPGIAKAMAEQWTQ